MSLTIYTVSDPSTVGSVMTSMAMFFGQDSWVGGAVKLALMVSLIVILAKGVLAREGLRLDVILLQVLIVWVMFIPKTTVVIEQFDNNAPPRVVDDVPYAIALPGSVAGAFSLYMTQKIETVMQGVDGKFIAPSGEIDPFMPARVLMQFATAPLNPSRFVDPNLAQTLYFASRYCAKPEMTNIKFDQTANGFQAFANAMLTDGTSTIIYDKDYPYRAGGGSGRAASCGETAAYISQIGGQLASGDQAMFKDVMDGIARTAESQRYSDNQTGTPATNEFADLLPILNRIAPEHAQLNGLALANVMSYTVLNQLARDAKDPVDRMVEMQRDTGLFRWAQEESAQSLMVTTTAPKFMDILFFIFIAATPIVMFVTVANPATGLKVAGAYVLFGLWTQSWIPMMAIISGWYQAEIKSFAAPGIAGLTPEYLSALMRQVSTATITASNMLQSAPYMMFAIMTGSMFAMSNMISKAAPSGGVTSGDAGAGSGGGSGSGSSKGTGYIPGSVAPNQSLPQAQLANLQRAQALRGGGIGIGQTHAGGDAHTVAPNASTLSEGAGVDSGVAAAQKTSAAQRQEVAKSFQNAVQAAQKTIESGGSSWSGGQLAKFAETAGLKSAYNASTGELTVNGETFKMGRGASSDVASQVAAKIGAQLSAGFNSDNQILGKVASLATGLKASAQANAELAAGSTNADRSTVNFGKDKTQANQQSGQTGNSTESTGGKAAETGSSTNKGHDWKQTGELARQATQAAQQTVSQAQSLAKADELTRQAAESVKGGSSTSINGADVSNYWGQKFAGNVSAGVAAKQVEQAMGGAISGQAMSDFSQRMQAEQRRLEQSHAGGTLSNQQMAMLAGWKALDDMGRAGGAQEKTMAMYAQAKLAAAAGMADVSGGLGKLVQANELMAKVNDNIGAAEQKMQAQVQPAMAKADAQLGQQGQIAAAAGGRVAAAKEAIDGLDGQTRANISGLPAQANAAVEARANEVKDRAAQNADGNQLANEALLARSAQPLMKVGAGEFQDVAKNPQSVIDAKPHPDATLYQGVQGTPQSGPANGPGMGALNGVMDSVSKVLPSDGPVGSIVSTVQGATSAGLAATAPVTGAGGGGGLPTLGNNPGINLSPAGGGGAAPPLGQPGAENGNTPPVQGSKGGNSRAVPGRQ